MKVSKFLSLNVQDFLKALIIATLTPVLLLIQQSIAARSMVFDWKHLGMAAVAGFVGYLLKNLLSPTQVVLTGKEADKIISDQPSPNEKI